jgi:uncharacterized protein with PIN domain
MPNLDPLRRKTDKPQGKAAQYRCLSCRESLHLVRRQMSPVRLGAVVTIEFYQCPACDSGHAFNSTTGKWTPWTADDE